MKAELNEILKKPTTREQLAAVINALIQSQCFDAEDEVARCLSHSSPEVRAAAADYLGSSANSAKLGRLITALQGKAPEVREKAAQGLFRLTSVSTAEKEAALLH